MRGKTYEELSLPLDFGHEQGKSIRDLRNGDQKGEAYQQEKLKTFVTLLDSLGKIPKPGVPDA